jgi:hypothetical protein
MFLNILSLMKQFMVRLHGIHTQLLSLHIQQTKEAMCIQAYDGHSKHLLQSIPWGEELYTQTA